MPVPNTFANATTSIHLSQLDQNFATAITLGNTAIQLGNTVTTLNNMTLANVTVNTGTVGGSVIINTTGTANTGSLAVTGTLSASGTVKFGGSARTDAFAVLGIDNQWTGSFSTGGLSAGRSYGLLVNAGTNASDYAFKVNNQAGTELLSVPGSGGLAVTGTLSCTGALSKGSGSFRITHPLPQLSETHQLVHSFIEGPKADLIYRGKVNLINGTATVNIDSAAGMTEGTFVALCRDVQCFTTNEYDWTPVRGSVSGNILTIEAQDNTSTASVSWMVIGERQDQHMYETDWTDDDGHVIVEPLKPVTVEVSE